MAVLMSGGVQQGRGQQKGGGAWEHELTSAWSPESVYVCLLDRQLDRGYPCREQVARGAQPNKGIPLLLLISCCCYTLKPIQHTVMFELSAGVAFLFCGNFLF